MRPAVAAAKEAFATRKDLAVAEVGVWQGDHAADMLAALPVASMLLVDPWLPCAYYLAWSRQRVERDKWADALDRDWNELAWGVETRFKADARVKIWRLASAHAARDAKDNSLDFVYLDGDHSFHACGVTSRSGGRR